ncbi:hypothetical protein Q4125_18670, partial [Acinetobacter baumannii]
MGSCAAPSAKGDDKFITTDYLQQCHLLSEHVRRVFGSMNWVISQGPQVALDAQVAHVDDGI